MQPVNLCTVKDLVLSLNQCPHLATEQKMQLPLALDMLRLFHPRWQAARRLKRKRGHALESWVSIKEAAFRSCVRALHRTASSHGQNGVAWPGTQMGSEPAAGSGRSSGAQLCPGERSLVRILRAFSLGQQIRRLVRHLDLQDESMSLVTHP